MIMNVVSVPIYGDDFNIKTKHNIIDYVSNSCGDQNYYKGYYTDNQLYKNELFEEFSALILEHVKEYLRLLNHKTKDGSNWSLRFSRMWATQFNENEYILKHHHVGQGAVISGVVYLKLPNNVESGIVFHPTHPPFLEKIPFDIDFSDAISLQEDTILLFPGELIHSGVPNPSKQQRISIAFDILYFDNLYGAIL